MKKRRNRSIQSAAIRTVFGLILVSSVLLASCTGIADPTETPTAAPTETPTAAPTETPTEAPTEPQPTEEDHDYPTDGRFYLKPGMKVVDVDPEVVLKVFQETALAYYYKNPYAQYNTRTGQTALGENGSWFMTPGISPEETTPEMPYYINCNGLAAEVYWQAFNFVSSGYRGSSFESSIRNEDVVFAFGKDYKKYAASGAQYFTDQAEFLETLKKELLPGDQILAFKTNGEGHVMLFLGDCFGDGTDNVIHAWPIKGGKWDKATGVDKEEPYGAAWIQTAKDLLYEVGPSPNWPLGSPEKMQRVVVLRYLNNEKFLNAEFTDAAITRYNKQGLVVTKESTFDVYDTVLTGEEISITEKLENHSAESYPVTVREYVAEGTAFVASSSTDLDPGTVSDNAVTWKVTVPAGGSVEVSYTVKVTADGYRELLFPAGAVSTLPTRELKTTVGKSRLTDEEIRTLQEKGLAAAEELAEGEFAGLGFLARFYEQVFGVQPAFPADLGEFLTALYEVKKPVLGADSRMLVRKEEPDEALLEFVIPRCELGDYYHNLNYLTNKDRIFTPKEAYFLPGDVLVEMHGANYQQYRSQEAMSVNVYLGGGKVLTYSAEGVRETTFEETFATASKYHYAVILRPMNGTER